jgi:hypothetical protein
MAEEQLELDEVEEESLDIAEEDVELFAQILQTPDKIIVKREKTERPQNYAGPKIRSYSSETIPVQQAMAEMTAAPLAPPLFSVPRNAGMRFG